MSEGRILAIDFGERRLGIAISDPTATIAQPLTTLLRRRGKKAPLTAILDLTRLHEVQEIVVGLPLTLAGEDSEWTLEVRRFAATLQTRSGLSVSLADERMTSVIAERAMRTLGLSRTERHKKERIDVGAAVVILQAFLDSKKRDVVE
jgi:putative holliday junction resolvase